MTASIFALIVYECRFFIGVTVSFDVRLILDAAGDWSAERERGDGTAGMVMMFVISPNMLLVSGTDLEWLIGLSRGGVLYNIVVPLMLRALGDNSRSAALPVPPFSDEGDIGTIGKRERMTGRACKGCSIAGVVEGWKDDDAASASVLSPEDA